MLSSYIVDEFTKGNNIRMLMFRLSPEYNAHRMDIKIVDSDAYPFSLLYFTGSQRFNILLRQRAKELGYILNEYGLWDKYNNRLDANSE